MNALLDISDNPSYSVSDMTSDLPNADVTKTELAVLEALWQSGPSTIRTLTDVLYPEGGTAHYATVQKLLARLTTKGCVARAAEGRSHVYRASIDRDALIAHRLQATADRLCNGSLTPLLTHLVDRARLTGDDLTALRALVADLDPRGGEAS